LKHQNISIVEWEYGYNLGIKFQYLEERMIRTNQKTLFSNLKVLW
jgi:hypothetical protein